MTSTPPPAPEPQDVCASDPNFAAIFAFCERFGDSCGITIPTFQELQDMLEKTTEVPDTLVNLHIKLLRRVKKSVHVDKWEKAILKFCQAYSIPEFWELEHYGYKGISVKLKLRILKTLLEAQFDSNVKFKAEINKLESSTLRSQPLGWDKSGTAYWVQFDRACNLRVYKEDSDEHTWKIVAKDRSSLVNLINELSGSKDYTLDDIEDNNSIETGSDEIELSSNFDQEKLSPASPSLISAIKNNKEEYNKDSKIKLEKEISDSEEQCFEKSNYLKKKLNENFDEKNNFNNTNSPIVGETIEESVMIVKGEGSGQECDTGNPDEPNTQNETSKNEDIKKPKLWSIDTICSSSKEVKEEIISVPKTGFFFGDDSVPCFNNMSNGESSHLDENLKIDPKQENKELKTTVKSNEFSPNTEVDSVKSTNKEYSTKKEEEFISENTLKQSVFNIKIHEEEVQITERKADEVFMKSDLILKNNTDQVNANEPMLIDSHSSKTQTSQLISFTQNVETNKDLCKIDDTDIYNTDNVNEKNTEDKHDLSNVSEEVEYKKIDNGLSDQKSMNVAKFDVELDKHTVTQETLDIQLIRNIDEIQLKSNTPIDDNPIKTVECNSENSLEIKSVARSKVNKEEKIAHCHETFKANESLGNVVDYYADNNEQQNVELIMQNQSKLDNTTLSNEIYCSGTILDDQILPRVCNVIDNEETIKKLTVEDSKPNEQISEDVKEHNTDNLETNATYLTDDLNQHSKIGISIINETDSSSSSKVHDQIITGGINQCLKTSNQINNDQNITPKITSHNIRNIIDTEVINDSVKANEQLTNIDDNKNKQMESCQIKNESYFVNNVLQEENKPVHMDSQFVSNSKHNLNKLFKKSNEVENISENFFSMREKTENENKLNEPGSSSIEVNKINIEKSEINIKQSTTKTVDISNRSTIVKEVLIENKNNSENISENLNSVKEKTEKDNLLNEPGSSNIEINKTNIEKCEVSTKQLKTKTMDLSNDLIIVKEDVCTRKEKNTEKMPQSFNPIKEKTEMDNLLNEPGSSNIEINKTNIKKSEISIKDLKPKTMELSNDLTIVKEVLTGDEKRTEIMPDNLNSVKEKAEKTNLLNEPESLSIKINLEKSEISIKQSKTEIMDISNNMIVKEVLTEDEKHTDKMPESLNSIKEKSKKVNLLNESESTSIEINKVDIKKSEIDTKQLKTKTMEISNNCTVVKEVLTGDVKNTENIPESLNFVKEKIEKNILLNEPESSNIKINIEKSEIVTKQLKTQNISNDLTVVKEELMEDRINTNPFIQSVSNQNEIVNIIDQIPKGHLNSDEIVTMSSKQYLENEMKQKNFKLNLTDTVPVVEEIQLNKSVIEKQKLINIENKIVNCKKNLEILPDKKNVEDIVNKSSSITKSLDKTNFDGILQDKNIQNQKEECIFNISKEEHIISPTSTHERTDENNEEVLTEDHKYDNSELINQTIQESDNKNEEVEEMPKKKGRPGRKKGKRGKAKNFTVKKETKIISENRVKRQYKPRQKKVVPIVEEVTTFPEPANDDNVRRSRRIAEIKIKEQVVPNTQYDDIDIPLKALKKKDKIGKKISSTNKKIIIADKSDDEDDDDNLVSKKLKKKKRKGKSDSLKKINVVNPWNVDSESSSSENNVGLFEDYDHEEEDEIPRPGIEPNVSDHEFSPESDINEDDDEYFPEKRARTAHKEDQGEELDDDMSCKKCNKSDQPEWILLCDTCNQGWHASCLRPALMAIPDGDWYCPLCRHETLLSALKDTLKRYDGESKKRENEELRRKRLEYVGISLQNVIPSKTEDVDTKKEIIVKNESSEDDEESESESYDSEPLYQLRARRQANVSYRFNDYDNMIDEAIFEETGVDESASRKLTEGKMDKSDNDEKTDSDNDNDSNKNREDSPIAPALLHLRGRKKSKKLTNLDISSDDGSDEDFKGPSDGDEDYDEDLSEYSDDSVKRRPQPTRRSVRSRKTVVDPDFINDDSSEESDDHSKKKRSRPWSDSSNSEEEDFTWGKKKKKRTIISSSSSYKQPKGSKRKHNENRKQKSSKIKYGMDSDSDDQPQRRTRGRQITYAESDDSEVEIQTKKRKILSDEEDEYVLNDEELEVENEDHNLETDEEDTVVSNEEENKEETDDEKEEAVDKEEETVDKEDNEEEGEEEENSLIQTTSAKVLPEIVKSPSVNSVVIQSVIREPITTVNPRPNTVHQRLLLEMSDKQISPQLPINPPTTAETLDKRKRPVHQQKKCPSPNPPVDYVSGGCYPYPPDATKVVTTVPPLSVQHTVSYNRTPVAVSNPAGGFKPMVAATLPSQGGLLVTPYRTIHKNVTETVSSVTSSPAYHTQQVQQVYQAPMPTNYSSYPIDYASTGTTLPPALPPSIPFRNVVVAPAQLHEPQLPPTTTLITQQSSVLTTGGDSEFGGLVSYFSSQQEDDFDV